MSSAKSVRSDIICAINRDDSRRILGRTTTPLVPNGPSHLLDDTAGSLKESNRMSGTSLLRNPSQTFFKKEVLPSSSDITVEDGHLQIIKPFEPASEEGDKPWQDEAAPVKESSLNDDENLTQHQEPGAENSDDKGSEKSDSGRSDSGSLDTGPNLSLETQPVDPSSPPTTPEDKDVTTAAAGELPTRSPNEAECFSVTSSNIDFELEISERASPREAEEASQGSEEKDVEGEGDVSAAVKEGEEEREQKRGSKEDPHRTHSKDGKESEGHQLPSVLRSKEGGRARSSSVGHKVRFTSQCSLGESDNDPASGVQDDSRASRRQGRRHRSKVHRSVGQVRKGGKRALDAASVTGMDDEERDAATTRREYHTLLREIQALMSEVQRQRNDFRSELRSLTSTIIRRHNSTSARPCVCSAPRKTSRLPVMVRGRSCDPLPLDLPSITSPIPSPVLSSECHAPSSPPQRCHGTSGAALASTTAIASIIPTPPIPLYTPPSLLYIITTINTTIAFTRYSPITATPYPYLYHCHYHEHLSQPSLSDQTSSSSSSF
ncbi:hypothetical protein E2C01_056871 [Portunus trituberculatus]|uniref:Uncharacterized protein n=1 Tax=Portunus trituberculatus TaxID=210409 RepID=A0A5B7GRI9_PORTR|nr:hypothetical protein [Portunus trituberculatus]